MAEVTRRDFARAFLKEIEAPITKHNMRALISWMQAEGSAARFNPLATTQDWPNSTSFNSVGVRNYRTLADGVEATAKTLDYGADHDKYGYRPIRKRLRNNAWAYWTLRAVETSLWGTGGLALRCLPWVKKSFESYADQPIGQ